MTDFDGRQNRLESSLPDSVDALVVSALVNVRYLTGFTSSNAAMLIGRGGSRVLATDGRYITQAAEQAPDIECLNVAAVLTALADRAASDGVRRVGFESRALSVAAYTRLAEAVGERVDLVPLDGTVEGLRVVKEDLEIEALARACEITDAVFAAIVPYLREGVTEREVAWELERLARERGADGLSFEPIVAFGPNSAIPHHSPTDRSLGNGDLVKLDFGARYDGYHADMTRTAIYGRPADWQREIHSAVLAVQGECREFAADGVLPRDLDALARRAVDSAGFPVMHGLGHGVGLEIHEAPFLTAESTALPLSEGVPFTVEPGIYLPGRGGVRIEDTCVIAGGRTRPLTTSTRELLEVS